MDYQFSEIRKNARGKMLAFAKEQGCHVEPTTLRHYMSLAAWNDNELAAVALCVERDDAQFIIEIASPDEADAALVAELVDRCLRKMQAQGILSARLHGSSPNSTKSVWQHAGWLGKIQETPPPTPNTTTAKRQADQGEPPQAA